MRRRSSPNFLFTATAKFRPKLEEAIEQHLGRVLTPAARNWSGSASFSMCSTAERLVDAAACACRQRLRTAIRSKKEALVWEWQIPFRIPVGAMALVAFGFFGGPPAARAVRLPGGELSEPMFSSVSLGRARHLRDRFGWPWMKCAATWSAVPRTIPNRVLLLTAVARNRTQVFEWNPSAS